MNREAILEVAQLIENADQSNFHMGSWFGRNYNFEEFDEYRQEELSDSFGPGDVVNQHIYYRSMKMSEVADPVFQNTLSCNTTACIAGWTVFNQWLKNDKKDFSNEYYETSSSVEYSAKSMLGLNSREAARLFFCEYGSIWDEVAHQYEFDYDRDVPETWNIPNVMAAHVLRRIANGELILDDEYNYIEEDDEEMV